MEGQKKRKWKESDSRFSVTKRNNPDETGSRRKRAVHVEWTLSMAVNSTSSAFGELIQSRRMRWARHVARMGEMRNIYRIFVGKPKRERPHGRTSCRWEVNIKTDRKETGWEGVDWMHQNHAPSALPRRKNPRYILDRSLGGPHGGEEKKIPALVGIRTPVVQTISQVMFN
jgi:hypothetical protein